MCNSFVVSFFFFNDTATTEIYTLSLHDALPISLLDEELPAPSEALSGEGSCRRWGTPPRSPRSPREPLCRRAPRRSEEHTSELQSRQYLVCRLLLEKKNKYLLVTCVIINVTAGH